jgi:hypothetical protein
MAALLVVGLARGAAVASATAVPEKTDVMFVFDTSGSMGEVLNEAKEEIEKVITETNESIPNAAFGVANVEDIPGNDSGPELFGVLSEEEYELDHEKPWRLDLPVTTEPSKVFEAIDNLELGGGGDGPEAYGRALWETDTNPQVGWRPGARHEIVLIADEVPHTPNVNEGIPEEFWYESPFETGEEFGGRFGIPGTQWKEGESLEFHKTLEKLAVDGKPLAMVDYHDTEGDFIHYWEYWAAQTGGQALEAQENGKEFGAKLVTIVKETTGRSLPACPTGYEPRTGEEACVAVPIVVAPTPPVSPTPVIFVPSTKPPVKGKVYVLEDGEVEEDIEFLEEGEFEDEGFIEEGASLSSFQGNPLSLFANQQTATTASTKCKKGFVHKKGKCVSNKPVKFGHVHKDITKAGRYKIKIKPSAKVLAALKKGKTLHVKFKLVFTPAGTTDHIHSVRYVTVHLKKKHHKG